MLASHSVSVGPAGTCTCIDTMLNCVYLVCIYTTYIMHVYINTYVHMGAGCLVNIYMHIRIGGYVYIRISH